jgi:hypothetical protein
MTPNYGGTIGRWAVAPLYSVAPSCSAAWVLYVDNVIPGETLGAVGLQSSSSCNNGVVSNYYPLASIVSWNDKA